MNIVTDVVRVVHIITAVLMAWPFYALVAVNQRALLGPPLGDRTDVYIENIVKNRTVPCFVFQATALLSGIALVYLEGVGLGALLTNPILAAKLVLLLFIGGLLLYVHFRVQPRLDALFAQVGAAAPDDVAPRIGALRLLRKRFASLCTFVVLTVCMLGVQVWTPFPLWLTVVLIAAIVVFTWRAFKSATPYGWA